MNRLTKYLHIISFDGLSKKDMNKLKEMPGFKMFLEDSSYCFNVKSVYPSVTYTAHTSINTGCYPKKHGIVNNTKIQMNRLSPDWFWYERDIKVESFSSLATKRGIDVLTILWPVGARSGVKFNLPEIFANRKWKNQVAVSLRNGTFSFQLKLNKLFGKIRDGIKEPELDDFIHESYKYSLENFKTDITMVHYIDLDFMRHDYGFNSKEADLALKRHDKRLEEIILKLKEIGTYDESTIIVLGDHSSIDIHSYIFVNLLFKKAGLLKQGKNNMIKDYKAVLKSCDGSAYIYADNCVSDNEILEILKPAIKSGAVEKVYSKKEAEGFGADPNCRFMLEANEGYLFSDMIMDRLVIETDELKLMGIDGIKVNNHGYSPHTKKDYETVFIAKGKGIKKNVEIEKMSLVDEGPTFSRIMGFKMEDVDGRVLDEIIDNEF